MTKRWEYTVNNLSHEHEYVLAKSQADALKLIFAKHQGIRIYPVRGQWGKDVRALIKK